MAFDNFFSTLSQTAVDSDYRGIFSTSASTVSLSANLSSLSAEGSDIVKFVRYRMGEPKVVCELDNLQIFAAFEESTIEYSSMINKSKIVLFEGISNYCINNCSLFKNLLSFRFNIKSILLFFIN